MYWLLGIVLGVVFYSFGIGVAAGFMSRRLRCPRCCVNERGVVTVCKGSGEDHDMGIWLGSIVWPFTLVGWLILIVLRAALHGPAGLVRAGQRLGSGVGWQPTDST